MRRSDVAALYVDPKGPYPRLLAAGLWYDEARDARTYAGPPTRAPTHWCSGVHTKGARGETPPGIKVCSAQQRRRTPIAFAEWLLELASRCGRQS